MSCIYYSHTGKRAEIHLIHTPAARAVCHHEDDESREKSEVAAQLHKSGHQNKDETPRSPSKALESSTGHQNPENVVDFNFCFAPPLHICLQAVIWMCTWRW